MKILLSAFSCAPNTGSEAGGAWNTAVVLSKNHDVWVLTDIDKHRMDLITKYGGEGDFRGKIIYFRPSYLQGIHIDKFWLGPQVFYQLWLNASWKEAEKLNDGIEFDFIWHISWGNYRHPVKYWKIGVPFVFGPLGGGESVPIRLRKSLPIKERMRLLLKDFMNLCAKYNPSLYKTVSRADLVMVRTVETLNCLPSCLVARRAVLQQEIGVFPSKIQVENLKPHSGFLHILTVGRLTGLKGVHFAILAMKLFIESGGKGRLTIIGSGSMKTFLFNLVVKVGAESYIEFIDRVPQNKLFQMYGSYDVLLFPSLADSGGNVVPEALSYGLPVICSDSGGPSWFLTDDCGIIIKSRDVSECEYVEALKVALLALYSNSEKNLAMKKSALIHSASLTWKKQVERELKLIEPFLNLSNLK